MSEARARRLFYQLFWLTLLLKLAWAAWLPLTGDEAYFTLWGRNPDFGYYDHPPMVGWWLSLLELFGSADWWLRLPAILLNTIIAVGIYRLLQRFTDETRALLGGALYLVAPLNLVNVLITTDTPLILLSFFSAWCFYLALQQGSWRWYLLSGLLLGAAFLSKYFAVLLGLSYGFYILLFRRNRNDLLGLLWLFLAVLPFAGLNVWWNSCNCWDNILFNLYNRRSDGGNHTAVFLVMLAYMVTPPLLWYGWKVRGEYWQALRQGGVYHFLWLAPMLLFLLLSLQNRIGLHWVLAFYPFVFITLVPLLSVEALRTSLKFMFGFSLLHALALAVFFAIPVSHWEDHPVAHNGMLMGLYPKQFVTQFEALPPGYTFATQSYVDSALLEKASGLRFIVFGLGSKYGRQDDLLTDWRLLDGKNIAVLLLAETDADQYLDAFESTAISHFEVDGRDYYLLAGKGFRYTVYREHFIVPLRERYYNIPPEFPAGQCYFRDRYFSAVDGTEERQ